MYKNGGNDDIEKSLLEIVRSFIGIGNKNDLRHTI